MKIPLIQTTFCTTSKHKISHSVLKQGKERPVQKSILKEWAEAPLHVLNYQR